MRALLDVAAMAARTGWSLSTARRYAVAWHDRTRLGDVTVPRTMIASPPATQRTPPRPRYLIDAEDFDAWLLGALAPP